MVEPLGEVTLKWRERDSWRAMWARELFRNQGVEATVSVK